MKTLNAEVIIVLCTAPDKTTAQDLTTKTLNEQLAACVTMLPGAISLYNWKGKLECKYEVQMLFKTDLLRQEALLNHLKFYHPYQTPELLVLSASHVDNDYLSWLSAYLDN